MQATLGDDDEHVPEHGRTADESPPEHVRTCRCGFAQLQS